VSDWNWPLTVFLVLSPLWAYCITKYAAMGFLKGVEAYKKLRRGDDR
jgi:hypothetical protein